MANSLAQPGRLPSLDTLIFDLDGVIIDSEPLREKVEHILFAHFGLAVPETAYPGFKGVPDRDVIAYVIREYGDETFDAETMLKARQQIFREYMHELVPIPGVVRFVRAAAAQYRLAITTSSDPLSVFIPSELDGHFEVIVTANDVQRAKPDPQPYLLTVERMETPPGRCLVIEDSVHGVHAAVHAGCLVAGLTTTFCKQDLVDAGASFVVDSFDMLARKIGLELEPTLD